MQSLQDIKQVTLDMRAQLQEQADIQAQFQQHVATLRSQLLVDIQVYFSAGFEQVIRTLQSAIH